MFVGAKCPTFAMCLPGVVLEVQKEYRNHQGNKIRENDEVMPHRIQLLVSSERAVYTICASSNGSKSRFVSLVSLNNHQLNL